jgi:tetratricopeptide (TPR) repeat protein
LFAVEHHNRRLISVLNDYRSLDEPAPSRALTHRKVVALLLKLALYAYIICSVVLALRADATTTASTWQQKTSFLAHLKFGEGIAYFNAERGSAKASFLEALELYERLVTRYPDESSYRYHVAMCCGNLGMIEARDGRRSAAADRFERAIDILRNLCAGDPSDITLWQFAVDARIQLAVILIDRTGPERPERSKIVNLCDESIEALQHIISLRHGGDSREWFALAQAYAIKGDGGAARQWYEKAVTWMDDHAPDDETLMTMRARAVSCLKLETQPSQKPAVK